MEGLVQDEAEPTVESIRRGPLAPILEPETARPLNEWEHQALRPEVQALCPLSFPSNMADCHKSGETASRTIYKS